MAAPTIPDYRDPAAGRRLPPLAPNGASVPADPEPCPVAAPFRAASELSHGCDAVSQPAVDHEQIRATAYAAVTAHLERDDDQVAVLVHELLQQPVDAASALLALIQACRGLAERWGHDVGAEPIRAWASYLEAIGRTSQPANF